MFLSGVEMRLTTTILHDADLLYNPNQSIDSWWYTIDGYNEWFYVETMPRLLAICLPDLKQIQMHINTNYCWSLIWSERRRRTPYCRNVWKIKKGLFSRWNISKKSWLLHMNSVKMNWYSLRKRFSICKMYSLGSIRNKLLILSICFLSKISKQKDTRSAETKKTLFQPITPRWPGIKARKQ